MLRLSIHISSDTIPRNRPQSCFQERAQVFKQAGGLEADVMGAGVSAVQSTCEQLVSNDSIDLEFRRILSVVETSFEVWTIDSSDNLQVAL